MNSEFVVVSNSNDSETIAVFSQNDATFPKVYDVPLTDTTFYNIPEAPNKDELSKNYVRLTDYDSYYIKKDYPHKIFSVKRGVTIKIRRDNKNGYHYVNLSDDGLKTTVLLHRIIAYELIYKTLDNIQHVPFDKFTVKLSTPHFNHKYNMILYSGDIKRSRKCAEYEAGKYYNDVPDTACNIDEITNARMKTFIAEPLKYWFDKESGAVFAYSDARKPENAYKVLAVNNKSNKKTVRVNMKVYDSDTNTYKNANINYADIVREYA